MITDPARLLTAAPEPPTYVTMLEQWFRQPNGEVLIKRSIGEFSWTLGPFPILVIE